MTAASLKAAAHIQFLNVNYDSKAVIIGETESVKAC